MKSTGVNGKRVKVAPDAVELKANTTGAAAAATETYCIVDLRREKGKLGVISALEVRRLEASLSFLIELIGNLITLLVICHGVLRDLTTHPCPLPRVPYIAAPKEDPLFCDPSRWSAVCAQIPPSHCAVIVFGTPPRLRVVYYGHWDGCCDDRSHLESDYTQIQRLDHSFIVSDREQQTAVLQVDDGIV